nr:hypothetical protein [Tanacetum cinerariifolium]
MDTLMVEKSKLDEDKEGKAIDPSHYHGMIGTLLYLTASRHDLQFAICMCARYQARPIEKHDSSVALTAFAYADHAGCQDTHRSTSGRLRFLGERLISWSSKMQKSAAISNYGLGFNKIPMYCDNKSAIALCCNNVQHSRSKHIDIRCHFIKEQVENGVIKLYFVNTEYQLADLFTKALGRDRIEFLINKLGMRKAIQADCDVKATNIVLQGLPPEYASQAPSSTPLSITYPSHDFQFSVNHNVYNASSSIPQMEYAPAVHPQSEFSLPDTRLVVLVFHKGDDPIAINHMMSFLTTIVTSQYPATNNQLRTSSNPRQQATIN